MPSASPSSAPGLRELLEFYAQAGVDEALAEEPIDRTAAPVAVQREPGGAAQRAGAEPVAGGDRQAPGASSQPSGQTRASSERPALGVARPEGPVARPPAQPLAVPDEGQVAAARQRASQATSLEALRAELAAFDGCNLKFTAKNLVFADGNPDAPIMFVGEAPGREEDLEGLPFVGKSGQLLDRMLAAIGLDRTTCYIANVIPWRPPGNRDPSPIETEICRPFIERQIELVNPRVMVTLGNASTKVLLKTTTGIMRMRGNWTAYRTAAGVPIPTMPTLHPAALLRNTSYKKFAWRDFLEVKARLKALA